MFTKGGKRGRVVQNVGRGSVTIRGRGRGRGAAVDTGQQNLGVTGRGRGRGRGAAVDTGQQNLGVTGRGRGRGRGAAVDGEKGKLRANVLNVTNVDAPNRFEQATSTNLPIISYPNVAQYFQKLRVPEQRQSKDAISSSPQYGDNAIGYVKIRRASSQCVVEGRITPQTSVNDTPYIVSITVDEVVKEVTKASCNCQASMTNCKHQTALIFWLLRRSEEPSPTEIECYWKKSTLSTVKNVKSKAIDELSNRNTDILPNENFLKEFIETGKESNKDAAVVRYSKYGVNLQPTLYLDHLIISFTKKKKKEPTCDEFLEFCRDEMTDDLCQNIFSETKEQSAKSQWYYLRFGRITASKLYETSRCATYDGSLVGSVMGSRGFKGNSATRRGQKLEAEIFELLQSSKYPAIKKCGVIIRSDMPVFVF